MSADLKAPFPYFGGKRPAAKLIWQRLGNVPHYVEPFAGSLAAMLARPHAPGSEIVNDANGWVANAWRAIAKAPDEVAEHCDWPVIEVDVRARHKALQDKQAELFPKLESDPEVYDAKLAAYWIWGTSLSIASAFGKPKYTSIPAVGGSGVTAGLRDGSDTRAELVRRMRRLSARLRLVKVMCGDWSRVCSKAFNYGNGLTGVLLDPPLRGRRPRRRRLRSIFQGLLGGSARVGNRKRQQPAYADSAVRIRYRAQAARRVDRGGVEGGWRIRRTRWRQRQRSPRENLVLAALH